MTTANLRVSILAAKAKKESEIDTTSLQKQVVLKYLTYYETRNFLSMYNNIYPFANFINFNDTLNLINLAIMPRQFNQ